LPVDKNHVLRHLSHIVVVPFLLRAGFRDEWVKEFTIKRICLIHDFVTLNQYDIYDDILKYKAYPNALEIVPLFVRTCMKTGGLRFLLSMTFMDLHV